MTEPARTPPHMPEQTPDQTPDQTPERTDAFIRAWTAVSLTIQATPELAAFAPWPEAARLGGRGPMPIPAADLVASWLPPEAPADDDAAAPFKLADLHRAVAALAALAEWRLSYTEEELGADFLARYGYFEFLGPEGHFEAQDIRAYIAYWGPGLYYPWHRHEAEELYFVISGEGIFEVEGQPPRRLGPGGLCHHRPFERHALTTGDAPILTLVLWRGAGLIGLSELARG